MFTLHKQAIEEEGGNPDEIIVAPEATSKKVNLTPKRAAKGNVCMDEPALNCSTWSAAVVSVKINHTGHACPYRMCHEARSGAISCLCTSCIKAKRKLWFHIIIVNYGCYLNLTDYIYHVL